MCFDCFGWFRKESKRTLDVPERWIVIIGNQGSGKSYTGNAILGKHKAFLIGSNHPVTKKCQKVANVRQGKSLIVIDTPALNYPDKNFFGVGLDLLQFVDMVPANGPHVFVFTIELDRLTKQTYESITCADLYLCNKLGEHGIICFTKVSVTNEKLAQMVEKHKKENKNFASVLEQFHNRYFAIDKSLEGKCLSQFLSAVEAISRNGRRTVSRSTFSNVRKVLKELKEKNERDSSWETQQGEFVARVGKKEN